MANNDKMNESNSKVIFFSRVGSRTINHPQLHNYWEVTLFIEQPYLMCMYFPLLFMLAICTSNRYVVVPQWPTATAQQAVQCTSPYLSKFFRSSRRLRCLFYILPDFLRDRQGQFGREINISRDSWEVKSLSRKLLFKNLKLCWWLFQMVFRPFYVTRIAWHAVHFWCPRRAHYFVLEFRWQFWVHTLVHTWIISDNLNIGN